MFSHQASAHCWCDALLNVHLMSPSAWSDAGSSQRADQTSFCSAARRLNQVLCASRSIFSRLCRPCPGSSNTTTTRPAARKRACGWKEAFVRPDDCESLYWQRKPGVKWCDAAERPPLWPRIKLWQERRPWQIPTAGRSGEFCMNSGVIQSVATRWLAFWVDSPPALSHSQGQSVSSQQSVSVLGFVWVEKVTSALRDVLTHFHIYTRQNKEMVWSQRQKWRIIVKVCPLKSPLFKDFHMFIWCHFHLLPTFYSGKEIRALLWDCDFILVSQFCHEVLHIVEYLAEFGLMFSTTVCHFWVFTCSFRSENGLKMRVVFQRRCLLSQGFLASHLDCCLVRNRK